MKQIMKKFIILLIVCPVYIVAQIAEGGGAYIKNNGKLVNSLVYKNYAAMGFGVSGSSGFVINCNINGNLYLNKEIMLPGDLYLIDGSIYTPTFTNGILNSIPDSIKNLVVGVCFWSNANNNYINAQFWITSVDEAPFKIRWGSQLDVSNLYNYQTADYILYDLDGKTNTASILNAYGASATGNNCAAKFCAGYGTPSYVGKWFLPSGGQMRELLRSSPVINPVLEKLNKSNISLNTNYWVSNEYSSTNGWSVKTTNGSSITSDNTSKDQTLNVRPMFILTRSY